MHILPVLIKVKAKFSLVSNFIDNGFTFILTEHWISSPTAKLDLPIDNANHKNDFCQSYLAGEIWLIDNEISYNIFFFLDSLSF